MEEEIFVLIIDDDNDIHYFLKRFFRKAGLNTIHSYNLNDAKAIRSTALVHFFR